MNWHTDCYACTCTISHHPEFQFVRPLPGARAIGRRAAPSSCSPATLIVHDQMYDGRRAGARSWGSCDRHAPVRGNFVRGRVTDLLKTCRGFGLGLFGAEGHGANRVLAKPYDCPLGAKRLKNFTQGSERHFIVSSLYALSRSDGVSQGAEQISQGRGNV